MKTQQQKEFKINYYFTTQWSTFYEIIRASNIEGAKERLKGYLQQIYGDEFCKNLIMYPDNQ